MGTCTSNKNKESENNINYRDPIESFADKFTVDTLINYQNQSGDWKRGIIFEITQNKIVIDLEIYCSEYKKITLNISTAMKEFIEYKLLKIETSIPVEIFNSLYSPTMVQFKYEEDDWKDAEIINIDKTTNQMQIQFEDGSLQNISRSKLIIDYKIYKTVQFPTVVYPSWIKSGCYITMTKPFSEPENCQIIELFPQSIVSEFDKHLKIRNCNGSSSAEDIIIYATQIRKSHHDSIQTLKYIIKPLISKAVDSGRISWKLPSICPYKPEIEVFLSGFMKAYCPASAIPQEIYSIIHDYCNLDHGTDLLLKIANAKTNQVFMTSVVFMYGFHWYFKICPKRKERHCSISEYFTVTLCVLPTSKKINSIVIDFAIIMQSRYTESKKDVVIDLKSDIQEVNIVYYTAPRLRKQWEMNVLIHIKSMESDGINLDKCAIPAEMPYIEYIWNLQDEDIMKRIKESHIVKNLLVIHLS